MRLCDFIVAKVDFFFRLTNEFWRALDQNPNLFGVQQITRSLQNEFVYLCAHTSVLDFFFSFLNPCVEQNEWTTAIGFDNVCFSFFLSTQKCPHKNNISTCVRRIFQKVLALALVWVGHQFFFASVFIAFGQFHLFIYFHSAYNYYYYYCFKDAFVLSLTKFVCVC